MVRPMLKKLIFPIMVCIAAAILNGFAASAQSSIPTAGATATTPSPLPNAPTPISSQIQPQQQAPQITQPESSSSQPPVAFSTDRNVEVTVLENTLMRVRTDQPLSSRYTKDGAAVLFTLSEDVVVDNVLVIPRGATIHGEVIQTKKAGVLAGSPELTLKLVSLDLGGRSYPLYTYQFKVQGTSKTKPTETKVKGGAVIGAIVGGAFSGSAKGGSTAVGKAAGMATGAALGAGVGTMASAATPGPTVTIPAEAQMDFYLASPISVVPVSAKEAARLAPRLHPGEPILYVRDGVQ
jgi:hypothetical protein